MDSPRQRFGLTARSCRTGRVQAHPPDAKQTAADVSAVWTHRSRRCGRLLGGPIASLGKVQLICCSDGQTPAMTGQTVVASANLLCTLPNATAVEALGQVLAEGPDLVGLQEWYPRRFLALRGRGAVRVAPALGLPSVRIPASRDVGQPTYHWVATLADGNIAGARADRFDLLEARAVLNVGPARCDRPDRFLRIEPPRFIAIGIFRDRVVDRIVALLTYHLTSGVQVRGQYRSDRPLLAARHREEVRHLAELVAEHQQLGHAVYAVGDSNFDGLRLPGLTSAWEGREDELGTLGEGRRKVDDIHGPGRAHEVRRLITASDHQAVLATRLDRGATGET